MTSIVALFNKKVNELEQAIGRKPDIIQIGCKDGQDQFTPILKTNEYNALLFEPIPHWYSQLTQTYANCDKLKIYNQALCDTEGQITMYWVDPQTHGDKVPDWYYGHSSIHYKHSPGHEWGIQNTSEMIHVDATRLDRVLENHPDFRVDVYVSDTEGNDIPILRQLDLNKYKPYIFFIESNKINDTDVEFLKNLFTEHNYVFVNNYADPRMPSTVVLEGGMMYPGVDLLAWRSFV